MAEAAPVAVTPWWKALQLRPEVVSSGGQIDDVQMSLFHAVHGIGGTRPPYSDPAYYGEITEPTPRLEDLLTEIAIRIGGEQRHTIARAVTRLDQGMGGGKSHACIGAYHLAKNPGVFLTTDIGKRIALKAEKRMGRPLAAQLGSPHVVVLPCDNMTPGRPVDELDGPAKSLYERFLWRLFDGDYTLYDRYRKFYNDKSQIANALKAVNRPVLVIVDEVLDYIGNGLDGANNPELTGQDMSFLRAFLDTANDVPHVAALIVMISSEKDKIALSPTAQERRADLSSLLERNGQLAAATEVGDFPSILRRRLFAADPASEVTSATAARLKPLLTDATWSKHVWDNISSDWRHDWEEQVANCYPFHPMLMGIAIQEWGQVTGFQRVRSTIRIFAASVYALQKRAQAGEWVPELIGPGDLPLDDSVVRESLLGSGLVEDERTVGNYRSLAEVEIVNSDRTAGTARTQDMARTVSTKTAAPWVTQNPRASERAATMIFLSSVVGTLRPGRGRGASAPEVKAATAVPSDLYTITDADTVLAELVNSDRGGMSALETIVGQGNNKPARYFLSTRLTHQMLVSNLRKNITDAERDEVISEFTQRLTNSGPFGEKKYVSADLERTPAAVLAAAGIDDAHRTRMVVLDPAQFSLRNGMEAETLAALVAATGLGTGTDQLPVTWASSAVFSVVNTQRRGIARKIAVEYLANKRALEAPEILGDPELKRTGQTALAESKAQLEKSIKRAYQHVAYLAQPDPDGDRSLGQITFDDDSQTALDGTLVWKALASKDKVFDQGQFTSKALVHQLRENDYGRTLSEIRSAFYSAPRLPLLFGGDRDLQQAIYDAVTTGTLSIVDGSGNQVAVTAATQVNLSSTGLRLAIPTVAACATCGDPEHPDTPCANAAVEDAPAPSPSPVLLPSPGPQPSPLPEPPSEQHVKGAFSASLLNQGELTDSYASLMKALYRALDERQISYLQGTLHLVCDRELADALRPIAEKLNITLSINDA